MGRIQMFLLGLALIAGTAVARAGFWEQLTPAERRAAGLDRLTPEQQAALNRLAERFLHPSTGPVTEATRQAIREEAKQEVREQVRAEVKQEVREQVRAEVKQEVQAAERKKAEAQAGLAEAESSNVIRTRIVGAFHGWSGATVFHLANGQIWMQTNNTDRYWVATMQNPEVELRSSQLGGWKLYLLDKGAWVRVHRLK
jgi:hypothetical protein